MVVLTWESVSKLDISQSMSVSFMTGIFKLTLAFSQSLLVYEYQ